jgi:alanine racemase
MEILKIVKGQAAGGRITDTLVKDILIDSRKLVAPGHSIFFAIETKRNDGHRYIDELFQKGLRNFVVTRSPGEPDKYEGANFIIVNNVLQALQTLAKAHREKFNIPIIGITGSNGKTIVKEWLYQLMSKDLKILRSPKSYNSQIGVPLSVWQLDDKTEMAIFEAGISEPDEMDKLQSIIKPTIGIFTNVGEAHGENFMSIQQKAGEKLKLFTKVDTLIYCLDHSDIREIIIRSELLKNIKFFTWSRKQEANLMIQKVVRSSNSTTISSIFLGQPLEIRIPFTDEASIENAIHCWATMLYLGMKPELIAPRFGKLTPIAMRLELKDGINHCTIINDSYNSDINSLDIAIDFLNQMANHKNRTIILSDILQSGKDEDDLYSRIAEIIHDKNINRIIGIGPAISRQEDKFNIEKAFYVSTDEFLRKYPYTSFSNEVILLKGARLFRFEEISNALQQKTHETVLEINLDALVHNLNHYRSLLNPETRIMAMVKAFSYGTGSFEIANALQFHRIDYLAVAYADEGVDLRKAGIIAPIMVMNPDEQSFDAMIKHNLEPEIYSFRILGLLEKAIRKNFLPDNRPVKIHVKLDTGMHRLGFMEEDLPELICRLLANNLVYTQSVFSHLSASEDPGEDAFTRLQIERFSGMSSQIISALDHPVLMHILNSAGTLRFPEAQFDMVRLGISLYGIAGDGLEQKKLENVSTLKSTISQIKSVHPDETIGYNRSYRASHEMRIAIIPIGYADGLSRRLGNGRGKLLINGKLAPIVGNVCMDMCMADITGINAGEGNEVIVFGKGRSIIQLAKEMETIPYEVLTSISKRVKRVYYHE